METVEEIFAPFGKEVISEVNRQVTNFGSLVPLLRRLNVPAVGNRIDEHRALREFIYKYGVFLFLKASQENLPADEVERLKVQKLLGYGGTTGPRPNSGSVNQPVAPATQPVRSAQGITVPAGPTARVSGNEAAVPNTGVSKRYTGEIKEQVKTPARKRIMTSTYYGPDRRKDSERRGRKGAPGSSERRAKGRRATDTKA